MTLVELLVVVSIIGLLAGAVAVIMPRFAEQSRVADGARQLQSWVMTARQRAVRDKAPRGIRFTGNLPNNTVDQQLANQFVYIEQPEDVTGLPQEILVPTNGPPQAVQSQLQARRTQYRNHAVSVVNAVMAGDPTMAVKLQPYLTALGAADGWRHILPTPGRNLAETARAGDVVEFGSARYTLMTDAVGGFPTPADGYLLLHRPRDEYRDFQTTGAPAFIVSLNSMVMSLPPYRITRAARPIAGEPELTLPRNVAVDILFTSVGSPETRSLPALSSQAAKSGQGAYDILFGPSGEVIGSLGSAGKIVLWHRDASLGEPPLRGAIPPGDNRLVVINTRTGHVTAHAVNATADTSGRLTDPYSYVRDGKSSALDE